MTTEEKAVLIGLCRIEIRRWDSVPDKGYMVELMNIALAALTTEPVAVPDEFIDATQNDKGLFELSEDCMVRLAVALYHQQKGLVIKPGWRLVPVEPTQKMVDAHINGVVSGGFQCGYRAMLAAAPTTW